MFTAKLMLREDVAAWTPTDDDTVIILDMLTSRYLSLNASASALWMTLAAGCTRQDLVDTLRSTYGLADDRAEHDVEAFLHDLDSRGLLDQIAGA